MDIKGRLDCLVERLDELNQAMSNPEVFGDKERYAGYAKEHNSISFILGEYDKLKRIRGEIKDDKILLDDNDEDIRKMAEEELRGLEKEQTSLEKKIKSLLVSKDPYDEKNIILEIRAGTGGEEAALFVSDLFRMYSRYCEITGWKKEVLNLHPSDHGGIKEVITSIEGEAVYSRLKYERGVHRVQRVPVTESQGRIHTSAVTVAVLPEADSIDVSIKEGDLKLDTFRSSGPGGQHVNKTDSAVRLTHLPTGCVVTCQDEKSQYKNKAKAMKILRARILDLKRREQEEEIAKERRQQVGTGDRSEKIRTYNFPQSRVTDHRIGLSLYNLDGIMGGELDCIIEPLIEHSATEEMKTGNQ